MWIEILFIDATKKCRIDSHCSEVEKDTTVGQLYKGLQAEYGRCKSAVRVDREGQSPIRVGWVFEKKMEYQGSNGAYIQEVWVTVLHEKPTTTKRYKEIS